MADEPQASARSLLGIADAYVGLAAAAVLAAWLVPFGAIDGLVPCVFHAVIGLPCPSCGFTRAFSRAAELNLGGALLVSPLGTLLFFGLAAFAAFGTWRIVLRRPWPKLASTSRWWTVLRVGGVSAVLLNWGYMIARSLLLGDWA